LLSESGSYLRLDLASVPREDKEAVLDLVHILVALSVKARHEGLLSLGEDVDAHRDAELAFFPSLITDGCEEETIDDLAGLMMVSELDVARKFRLFVIRLGNLSLKGGESPRMAAIYLREAFGRDADLVGEVDDLVEAEDSGRLFGLATDEDRRIALVRGLYERVSLLEPGKGSAKARDRRALSGFARFRILISARIS